MDDHKDDKADMEQNGSSPELERPEDQDEDHARHEQDKEPSDPVDLEGMDEEERRKHEELQEHFKKWQNYDFEKNIPANQLRAHIQFLMNSVHPTDPNYTGFDEEFNYIENQTAQEQFFGDYKSAMLAPNKIKNRYSNVLPPERTRVRLRESDVVTEDLEQDSTYINANFIDGLIPSAKRAYIATQGPLQSTFLDFWRMSWELNVSVIVMLTKEVENGRLKCDKYWPDTDCPMTIGPFKITLIDQEETSKDELTTRKMEILNMDTEERREVTQLQYTAWPDHGLPVSTTAFLELTEIADKANKTKGPIVVHCSAGIGRSGTFCTVHSTTEKLKVQMREHPEDEPTFNIVQTVLWMRSQRPGMVQTKEQYMFLYMTILEESEKLFAIRDSLKSAKTDL